MSRRSGGWKLPFIQWIRRPAAAARRPGPARRFAIERLEDRVTPASFAEAAGTITIALTANNETVTIFATGPGKYHLTDSAPNVFAGAVTTSSFTGIGAGSGDLTVSGSTAIQFNSGAFTGGHIVFMDSGANAYAQSVGVNLSAANGAVDFFGATNLGANALSVTATGAITVDKGAVVTANGSPLVLSSTGAAVTINGAVNTAAATLTVSGSNSIAEGVTGQIRTAAATAATFSLTGGAGTVTLNGANDVAGAVTITQSGTGSVTGLSYRNIDPAASPPTLTGLTALATYTLVTDNTSIPLANGANLPATLGTFNYTAGGNITETAALTFTTNASFTVLGDNSILLGSVPAGNSIPTVSFNAPKGDNTTAVNYIGAGGVSVGASTLGLGTFNVQSQGAGNISLTGAVTEKIGGGGSTFNVSGTGTSAGLNVAGTRLEGPVTVQGPALTTVALSNISLTPQFPTFPNTVSSLTVVYSNAPAVLPSIGSTVKTLNVNAQGIFQKPGSALVLNTATSQATFTAGPHPIVLGNTGNDFSSAAGFGIQVNNSGPNQIEIDDSAGGLNFGGGPSNLGNGTLFVASPGNITQSSAITQAANAGRTQFFTASNVVLTNAGNALTGIVEMTTPGSASFTNSVATTLGSWTIGDPANPLLNTATLNVTGALTEDPGTIMVLDTVTSITGTANITLDNNLNVLLGSVALTDANAASTVTIRDNGPLNLAASNVAGFLVAHAPAGVTQTGAVTGNPNALFDAGTAAVTLTNAGNSFTNPVSVVSTGSAAVQLTSAGAFQAGRMLLGSGPLTINAGGNISEAAGVGITQTGPGAITLGVPAAGGSITLNSPANDWLAPLTITGKAAGLTLTNAGTLPGNAVAPFNTGDISFVGTPSIGAGAVTLTSGGTITLPNAALSVFSFTASAEKTVVSNNITVSGAGTGITFAGAASLAAGVVLDSSAVAAAPMTFNGDVNPAGSLTLNVASGKSVNWIQGTWTQPAGTTLTIGGTTAAFNIGTGANPATFNMVSGTIAMAGGGNVVVSAFSTFEVGDTTTVGTADIVTVNNGAGALTFNGQSTLSVGLGATNDKLVDGGTGAVTITAGARLTAYSGVAGAAASPVLSGPTVTGTFTDTTYPDNNNAPHVFLMGTDIVTPNYLTNQVTVATGGTVAPAGTVTGYEADGDKYTITVTATGKPAPQLVTATDANGALDVVVRGASGLVTLTVTTTRGLGDGLTALGGVAVDGTGTVTINAPTTDINHVNGPAPFGDVLVQGPLAGLTLHDFQGNSNYPTFIRGGGTSAQLTSITGRIFDSVSISLPSVLNTLTLAEYTNNFNLTHMTAERFGTIRVTGIPNTLVQGDFLVNRLTNLHAAAPSAFPPPGLGTLSVADLLGGQFDIQGAVTSITAASTSGFALGLRGGANNPNGDRLGNVTALNLGIVTNSNIESLGAVASVTATSWNTGTLNALSFGSIRTTGNAALPTPGDFGNFNSIILTASGPAGVGAVSVAGDASGDSLNALAGNVTSVTIGRQLTNTTVNAGVKTLFPAANPLVVVTPTASTVGPVTAGFINTVNLNARTLTSINAVGNVPAGLPGSIIGATVLVQGTPTGGPAFAGVGLGTVRAATNIQTSSFTVADGSLTTVSVGYQISSSDFVLLDTSGKLGSLTAGSWNTQLNRGLVAASVGTLSITGAAAALPAGPILVGNLGVDILAFVNAGLTPGIGTFNVAGNFTLPNNGYLRSDNGITTFTVGRDVATAGGVNSLISVRNENTGRVGTMTVGRWNNGTGTVDFVADTIGTFRTTGYTALELPSKVNGDFLAANFDLLNPTKVDATAITVGFNQNVTTLLAPGGIGTLTVGVALLGRVDADNPAGTLGNIGTVQASVIGDTAGFAILRAVTFGTIRAGINVPLSFFLPPATSAIGSMNNVGDSVAATSTTAATGIGTFSLAGYMRGGTFNVPRSVTSFAVAEDIGHTAGSEIGAGYMPGQSLRSLTAGAIQFSTVTSNNLGTVSVVGAPLTVLAASVLPANVTNSLLTAEGNVANVGLGTLTVAGHVTNTDINVAGGNVTAVTVGGMFGSHLTIGAHPAARGDVKAATTASNWDAPAGPITFKLGTFKTTGLFDPKDVADTANFRDSQIIAQQLGTVTITGLDPVVPVGSGGAFVGVAFRGSAGAGPKITVSYGNVITQTLVTQSITAPAVAGTAVTITGAGVPAPNAFAYADLAG